jgi:hypothetical protein
MRKLRGLFKSSWTQLDPLHRLLQSPNPLPEKKGEQRPRGFSSISRTDWGSPALIT